MDIQQFEVLDQKIAQAIKLIQDLKTENKELRERVLMLESQSREKDEYVARMKSELGGVQKHAEETRQFREREERIRSKVEDMLAKLEELQLQL